MMRQGSFITGFFPDNIKAEYAANNFTHVGVFKLPTPAGATDGVHWKLIQEPRKKQLLALCE